jgi:hypothetical protein
VFNEQGGTTMTVYELKRALEDLDDNTEVRLAHQPSWPFEYEISQVVATEPPSLIVDFWREDGGWFVVDENEDPQDEEFWVFGPVETREEAQSHLDNNIEIKFTPVVYIAEGSQLGYLQGDAKKAVGW